MKFVPTSLAISALLFFSCSKKNNDNIDCLATLPPVYLDFNVVDSETDEDLFFSSGSQLESNDIYFFRSHDKDKRDSIRPTIDSVGQNRFFREDHLYFTFKNTEERCPKVIISELLMNDQKLKEDNGRIKISK